MISVDEINRAILEHEERDTTYANCEKLAWLYIVRDHITGNSVRQSVPVDVSGESEFLKAVSGADSALVWPVLDELMEATKITNKRVYDAVMRKLWESGK